MELESRLQNIGYEVSAIAKSGEEAILKTEELNPDLVLMDIRLGGEMDGIEAADTIRSRCNIPVVFSTAYLDKERIERAKFTMPFGYILKPIQERELQVTLEMALYTAKVDAERRRMEERLKFQAHLLDAVQQSVIVTDMSGKVVYWNPFAEKMYGWSAEEAIGNTTLELIANEDSVEEGARIMEMLQAGKSISGEYLTKRKDGHSITIFSSANPIQDNDGNLTHIVGISYDISHKKQMEDALKESEQRFRSSFKSSAVGMAIVDEEGKFLEVNPAVSDILYYEEDELLKKNYLDITHPDDIKKSYDRFGQCLEDFQPYNIEKRYLAKDGTIRHGSTTISPIFDTKGTFKYAIAHLQDITDRINYLESMEKNEFRMQTLLELNHLDVKNPKGILDFSLERCISLTNSQISFLGALSDDEKTMHLHAWSESTMADCKVVDKPVHFGIDEAGVWAEAIRKRKPLVINDYSEKNPLKKGLPEGHIGVSNMLALPVLVEGRIKLVVAVANKKGDYTEDDINQLQLFMDGVGQILKRLELENDLIGSEKKFRTIFNKSFQFALLLDTNGTILEMNELCYVVCGDLADGSSGLPFEDALWWSDFEDVRIKTKEAIKKIHEGKPATDEVVFIDKDRNLHQGTRIFSPITDDSGKLIYIAVVGLDLTERKEKEHKIKDQNERFRLLIENIDDLLACEVDGEGKYLYLNSQYEKILGYKPAELIGKNASDQLHPDHFDESAPKFKKLVDSGETAKDIWRFQHKNGQWLWFECNAQTYKKQNGETSVLVVSRQIDESEIEAIQ